MAGEIQETSSSSVLNMVLDLVSEILDFFCLSTGTFQVNDSKTYEESEFIVNAMRDAVLLG